MFSPLSSWLARRCPIPTLMEHGLSVKEPRSDWSVWVSVDDPVPLHLATTVPWQGLADSREATRGFLKEVGEVIQGLGGAWLDKDEVEMIAHLGPPPPAFLPLYLISVEGVTGEEVVYVGKTTSSKRFTNGHAAAMALHDPVYNGTMKRLYPCALWLYVDGAHVPVEWVEPTELVREVIDDVESQLIHALQPVLNTHKRRRLLAREAMTIQVENLGSDLLKSRIVFPPA